MSIANRPDHVAVEALLDYWLHDTDTATTEAIEGHLMECDACGATLDELASLGEGVREAFRAGQVAAVVSRGFLEQLEQAGLQIRQYRLAHNGSVNCTVAPSDDLLVARIDAPLVGVTRLDAVATLSLTPGVQHRLHDIPFDAASGEVVYLPKIAEVRQQPPHDMTLTLLAQEPGGERELGRYVFHHRPWPGH
jgi:hypothetical protein